MHFSVSGPGLSSRPHRLPPGSLILLDDQTPWNGHSLEAVCQETTDVLLRTGAAGLLLDFERPPTDETACLAQCLIQCCQEAGCPIGMPPDYLGSGGGRRLPPPLPCHRTPEQALAPYHGREIWLEAAAGGCQVTLGADTPAICPGRPPPPGGRVRTVHRIYRPTPMLCRYFSYPTDSGLQLALYDTEETLAEAETAVRPWASPWQSESGGSWHSDGTEYHGKAAPGGTQVPLLINTRRETKSIELSLVFPSSLRLLLPLQAGTHVMLSFS